MEQYRIDSLSVDQLDRIELPKFQRGFVWTNTKKNDFVQTLHDGYPFGTLLVYPQGNKADSKLQLLDGQQRLSTIKQYRDNPLRFWKPLNYDEYRTIYREVNSLLLDDGKLSEAAFDGVVNSDNFDIFSWINSASDDKDVRDTLMRCIKRLKDSIDAFVNLEQLKVPMVVYLGDEEHLADVFANLNKGGMPLSKYEVFNASWVGATIKLATAEESELQDKILQYVKQYYMDLQKQAEFELQNFSEDELTRNRTITLAEFGTALGQYVVDHLASLVPKTSAAVQEMGFGLLGVVVGLDNRKLKELNKPEHLRFIRDNIEDILQRTKRICGNLNGIFATLLRRSKNDGMNYENGLSTTFKTLSYFAALWRFDPSCGEYRASLHNIKAAYVYDDITSAWSSHGDQRLLEYQQPGGRDYLQNITVEQFRRAFDQWIGDQTPGINFTKEIRGLVTIHANLSYLSDSVPDGETFELEHIIARKRINAAEAVGGPRKILGNTLGNCMYLPKADNNAKKDKNLYEVNGYGQYSQLIEESQYFSQADMQAAEEALTAHDYDAINEIIIKRSRSVAYSMIDDLLKDSLAR